MLEKLKKFASSFVTPPVPLDTSKFNDPLAQTISWDPAKSGGSSFRTHKYYSDGYNRAEFRMSVGSKLFAAVFLIAGATMPIAFAVFGGESGNHIQFQEMLVLILFGGIFVGVGAFLYYTFAKPVVFDKMKGFYWKGWKKPDHTTERTATKNMAPLSEIHALQIVKEYVRSDKNSYYSYELNLVLRDGTRLNVVDHGKINALREEALKLSQFLGKPLWDAA